MGIAAGDRMLVSFVGRHWGQRTITTFPFVTNDVVPAADPAVAARNLIDLLRSGSGGSDILETKFLDCCSEDFVLEQIWAQLILPVRYARQELFRQLPGHELSGSNVTNIAVSITRSAALAGRSYVGRIQMPGVPDAWAVEGTITGTGGTKYVALATAMLATATDASLGITWFPALLHRTTPPTWSFVDTTTPQSTLRSQRSRTVGKGV